MPDDDQQRRHDRQSSYDPNGTLRVLGNGPDLANQVSSLTDNERRRTRAEQPGSREDGKFLIVSNTPASLAARLNKYGGTFNVQDGAAIYSDGVIGFGADTVNVTGTPKLSAPDLDLSLSVINFGSSLDVLNATAGLPAGLNITQDLLDRLLSGDPASGAPGVQTLILGASKSINFVGDVDLTTIDPATSKSLLRQFVLQSPAVYGYGTAAGGNNVTLTTDTFVWSGAITNTGYASSPVYVSVAPGAYNGAPSNSFTVNADTILFGTANGTAVPGNTPSDRLLLGFSTVNLNAAKQITANNKGSLSVYASGADLKSADTRAVQSKSVLASYYRAGGTSYGDPVTDPTTSSDFYFFDAQDIIGAPGSIYSNSVDVYLAEAW